MGKELTLCVVGCGHFARDFAMALQASRLREEGLELFFASRDGEKAKEYCRAFGGKGFFASYEEAASHPEIQALYLCTPHHLHREHTLLAARYRKHVLVEKPLARTREEARLMIAEAKSAGVKLMVAENYRYMPTVKKAKELLEQGALGRLRLIQVQDATDFVPRGWRSRREMMGGGFFIDRGVHAVDLLLNLGGGVEEGYAARLPQALGDLEGEDGMVVLVRLSGGAVGLLCHFWRPSPGLSCLEVRIDGSRGTLGFEPGGQSLTLETGGGRTVFTFPEDPKGIGAMVREFWKSILEDRPPLTSGEEGLRSLQVVLRAYGWAGCRREG